jgi:site-specific recombinase XerD
MMPTATRKRTRREVPEGLNRQEYDRLMDPKTVGDPRSDSYQRDRTLLELLAGTGLRINEALSLNRDRVDLVDRSVWIPAAHSKTGRARRVYFGESLRDKLAAYLSDMPPEQWALFVTRTGARLTDAHVRRLFKKFARRADIDPERLHPHALRHTYAIRYLSLGGTLEALRDQLGHASIATTQIYLQAASWQRAEQVARLDL